MPILAWRTDADGYRFDNSWTFDNAEQTVLASLASFIAPAAVGQVASLFPPVAKDLEFSSSDVACHVTLRWGVIHVMEGSYHASIARSVTKD